jgi:HD-like signal output (HDOD) protein
MTQVQTTDVRSVADRIRAASLRQEIFLPPMPQAAAKLTTLLGDEGRADARSVTEVLRNEPAMTACILRSANSAWYGGLRPISDLAQAVARLGLRQVASLVMTVAHKGRFVSTDPARVQLLSALWDQAVASALAAKRLAAIAGADAEESFIAGLLHDTGKLLVLKGLDEIEARDRNVRFTPEVVNELLDALHAELGFETLTAWKLPEPICLAARHHHADPPHDDPVVLRVQAADAIARKLGHHADSERDARLSADPAMERLNLSDLDLAVVIVDLEEEFETVRAMF